MRNHPKLKSLSFSSFTFDRTCERVSGSFTLFVEAGGPIDQTIAVVDVRLLQCWCRFWVSSDGLAGSHYCFLYLAYLCTLTCTQPVCGVPSRSRPWSALGISTEPSRGSESGCVWQCRRIRLRPSTQPLFFDPSCYSDMVFR